VIHVDAGAVSALKNGKSLLPAGVIKVAGDFARGDAVLVRGPGGEEIARGLVAYDSEDAAKIVKRSTADIALILGYEGRAAMIHRDDLAMAGD
jgi:glutamate 5-kinase